VDSKASLGQQQNAAGGKSSHMAAVRSLGLLHEVISLQAAVFCLIRLHAGLYRSIWLTGGLLLSARSCRSMFPPYSRLQ
jgi:hypothetical protein